MVNFLQCVNGLKQGFDWILVPPNFFGCLIVAKRSIITKGLVGIEIKDYYYTLEISIKKSYIFDSF